jgi:hypothetical protein
MTKADKIYKVKCTYDISSRNITFGMMPIRDPDTISITSAPEAPPPKIRIQDSFGKEVETVRIGDRLTFLIEIPNNSSCLFSAINYSVTNIKNLLIFIYVQKKRITRIYFTDFSE